MQGGIELVKITVVGQSFIYNQIRKMVGMSITVASSVVSAYVLPAPVGVAVLDHLGRHDADGDVRARRLPRRLQLALPLHLHWQATYACLWK